MSNFTSWASPGAHALLGLLGGHSRLSADGWRVLPPGELDNLLSLAFQHGVAPLLHRALQSAGALAHIPEHARARLIEERRATALDNLRNFGEFRRIARVLQEQAIPVIALKGLHLAELVYRDISLRPMGDLDILVPAAMVEKTVATLLGLGYRPEAKSASGYDITLTHCRSGILVEVHWGLATSGECYTAPIDDIWRLAEPARLGDAAAHVMSPEFLLLHVCAHLACHHLFAFDLRALCDIAEIVRTHPQLDWDAVIEQTRRHGWQRGIAASLRLTREQLHAAVPARALAAIGADTLDAELLADALEQLGIFSGIRRELKFAPNLLALTGATGWRAKLSTLWNRIFIPRAELALIYGVPERSATLFLYYAIRLRDLLRRFGGSAWTLAAFKPELAATVARHERLAKWVTGS